MRQVISAGGIISKIIDNNLYILFVTARNGLLSFPKGHVEGRESLEATAIREIKEEIGLKNVSIISKLGSVTRQGTEHNGGISNKTVHLFLIQATEHTYDHEDDFVWIEFNQAITNMKFTEERDFLLEHKNSIQKYSSAYFSSLDLEQSRDDDNLNFLKKDLNSNNNLLFQPLDYINARDTIFKVGINDDLDYLSLASEKKVVFYGVDIRISAIDKLSQKFDETGLQNSFKIKYKDIGNIINSDIPDIINVFYSKFSLNLSDTKTFFVINEVLKKMPIGGYFIIEGITNNDDSIATAETMGPNMIRTKDRFIYRVWDKSFVESEIIEKLQLKLVKLDIKSFMHKNKNRESLCFVAQKVTNYAY